ncbi:hypothetical protein NKH86_11945 [Mesorhizobium sp. M0913]|uniref:hypothetical protein n=1 Tax=Mesorhizobium sp. M0913 TaxID=2957026 RepID=UPI003337C5F6
MNPFVVSAVAVVLGIPAFIWGWENFQDPKTASINCLRNAMPEYVRQISQREVGNDIMSALSGITKDAESTFKTCQPYVQKWAARDGEMVVKRGVARVMLTAFAENTDEPFAKRLVSGLIKRLDEADAKQ